jgi:tartrate-resistant acid phosphatase type 5
MALLRPTRRELIGGIPLVLGAAAFGARAAGADPARPAVEFLVVGDWGRNGHDFQRHVARQMARSATARGSRFVVSTGDNFYELGVHSKTDRKWATSFTDIYRPDSLPQPWYPVLGNHDYGGNVHAQTSPNPIDSRWQMQDRWYRLAGTDIGLGRPDVNLLFLDTVAWLGKEELPFSLFGTGIGKAEQAAQRAWLIGELDRIGPGSTTIAFGHHPIYSVGPHGGAKGLGDLDDILNHYGVAAYVCGHDHCLYHIQKERMHYICSGAGSQVLTRYKGGLDPGCVLASDCPAGPDDLSRPYWHAFLSIAGFAAFRITDAVEFQFVDMGGNVRHSCRLPDCAAGRSASRLARSRTWA